MKKSLSLLLILGAHGTSVAQAKQANDCDKDIKEIIMQEKNSATRHARHVEKRVLENGMTVLVHPVHAIPKVSIQMFYNVGSKDEESGEKGIAHLIEHMIFKGTQGEKSLNLSESDINTVAHMLSGTINAFTTQDYTGYLFNLPTHNWRAALPIIADCMSNSSFKDAHLNSELKAVIQELKMRKDNYTLSLAESMMSAIFADHPYHYPIIGFKQDLWSVHGADLRAFYEKYYVPNKATLIVVGDVNPEEVFELAEKYFSHIEPDTSHPKKEFYFNKDIAAKSVTIYRDVAQPTVLLAFVVPGLASKTAHIVEILSWVLGMGKSSRLYKKIVDEKHLANSLVTFHWGSLFDHSIFFVVYEPNNIHDVQKINALVQQEIDDIVVNGLKEDELVRAANKARMKYYSLLEDMQQQASDIGKYFLATGDENYVFNYLQESNEELQVIIRKLLADYFRPSVMHSGMVLPLPASEKDAWAALQIDSDKEDQRILSAHVRTEPVELPLYANDVVIQPSGVFDFPKAKQTELSNGIKVLYYNNDNTPKINLALSFKAKDYFDPKDKQGLYSFVADMLSEGTENYTAAQLSDELESRGMSLSASPGSITMSMRSVDFEKGLELLEEVVSRSIFDKDEMEKVRTQTLSAIKNFWDTPSQFAGQLVREHIYKGHPYSNNGLGSLETVKAFTRKDLVDFYKKYISPSGARLAIVGDLQGYDVKAVLEKKLGKWTGPVVENIVFPELKHPDACEIVHPINRDQVLLCFAGLSVERKNPDYDKLLLFDQILGGGALGSMSSRLFELREQTGLFYSISGSLLAHTDEQPGMVMVKTLVSLDRLQEAEKAIRDTLAHVADVVEPEEFEQAKRAILNTLMLYFESNSSIANAFLFLDRFNLPADYFDKRAQALAKVTAQDMQNAVKKVLNADMLSIFKVGRVEKKSAQ